jgi:hypothetical protein
MDQVGPDPRSSGPSGQQASPNPWPTGQALRWFGSGVDGHVTMLVQKEYPRLEVCGIHMDGRPAVHLLQTNFVKSMEAPLCPYKSPPMVED